MPSEATLEGPHVRLEPLRAAHRDELWDAASEHDVWRHMNFDVRTPEDLGRWIEARTKPVKDGTALAFLQRDPATGAAFGSTSLFDYAPEVGRVEIGHTWIGRSHRGTKANPEAKLLLMRHAFEALGVNRVQLKCDVRNARSRAAILKMGATFEGELRSFTKFPDGTGRDVAMFSVVKQEWPAISAQLLGRLA